MNRLNWLNVFIGFQACAKLIRKTPCLEAIDIRGCNVSEQSMPILGRTLRLNTSLSVLHMEACQLTGKALIVLIAALKVRRFRKLSIALESRHPVIQLARISTNDMDSLRSLCR